MAPLPPIVIATLQSAVINGFSNVVAQVIRAQNTQTPLKINPYPVLQFFLYALLSTPPNFLWQEFLEASFPAYHFAPTAEAVASASADDEDELDEKARRGKLVEPALNKGNTLVKMALDQTVGAAVNTLLFSLFMHGIKEAVVFPQPSSGGGNDDQGGLWLWGADPVRFSSGEDVDWTSVWARARAEFFGILKAGWSFWPFVSLVNFVFLTSVEARNLVGSLAGLGWGVYMSLFAA